MAFGMKFIRLTSGRQDVQFSLIFLIIQDKELFANVFLNKFRRPRPELRPRRGLGRRPLQSAASLKTQCTNSPLYVIKGEPEWINVDKNRLVFWWGDIHMALRVKILVLPALRSPLFSAKRGAVL